MTLRSLLRRGRSKALLAAALLVLALAVWARPCYNPFRLQRAGWYAWTSPRFFRYCFVPATAGEAGIRNLLGSPAYVFTKGSAGWRDYLRRRRPPGSEAPPSFAGEKVLIYEDGAGLSWVAAYYFLGADGRLVSVFIGEA